jgi:class 3 adenylate cyclase
VTVTYPYHSLEDFLASNMLTVDAQMDDGWGASFPVKGREIEATILFADITAFSARTVDLDPTETLTFVNNFFTWIAAEALRGRPGIVDKYIGDEVMIVFSKEFGSEDPFGDAVQTARWMGQKDVLAFVPHLGIASGVVIVGYVGTPLRYNCSVFGTPVALAARCAGVPPQYTDSPVSSYATFPAAEWGDRSFDAIFPPETIKDSDGSVFKLPHSWKLTDPTNVDLKNLPSTEIRQVLNTQHWLPMQPAEDRPSLSSSCETLMAAFLLCLRARTGVSCDAGEHEQWEGHRGRFAGASRRRAEGNRPRARRADGGPRGCWGAGSGVGRAGSPSAVLRRVQARDPAGGGPVLAAR